MLYSDVFLFDGVGVVLRDQDLCAEVAEFAVSHCVVDVAVRIQDPSNLRPSVAALFDIGERALELGLIRGIDDRHSLRSTIDQVRQVTDLVLSYEVDVTLNLAGTGMAGSSSVSLSPYFSRVLCNSGPAGHG